MQGTPYRRRPLPPVAWAAIAAVAVAALPSCADEVAAFVRERGWLQVLIAAGALFAAFRLIVAPAPARREVPPAFPREPVTPPSDEVRREHERRSR